MTPRERTVDLVYRVRVITLVAIAGALLVALLAPSLRRMSLFVAGGATAVFVISGFPLRRYHRRRSKEWSERRPLHDDVLGDLSPSGEYQGNWIASMTIADGREVEIELSGAPEGPDAATLAHAREIGRSFADFEARILAFVASEKQAGLRIESLTLSGKSGMIFFAGGDPGRVWRCDYVDGEPRDLGVDS